ncbi:uncharacterized protein LOC115925069 [Strongylocentrotus purpuratus]|uniref:Uncharacterized protein n=1 Tax=Strongylocentrotus purpuratus TaxID=7668 RepID=A0A7M7NZU2_STRPU|nr:uncharacterized protein LOC115925069 [Strongylocentrotus purpuratus]
MAEKQEEEDVPVSSQGLTCPLCLDIFDDATLLTSCGHTFCRACLKKYDLSHQDLDHMVCPLCRTVTKFSANRVDDLLSNVTVNGLVDDYRARSGGASAIQEMRQKCTVCNLQIETIAFCITCNLSMCDQCRVGHKRQQMFFEGHEIVSIQDIIEGNVTPSRPSEKCSVHRLENKDMFCQDCKMRVCFKCVVIDHRDHKIKSHKDFEKEMQVKVSDLLHRCNAKKSDLEKNIQNVETHRDEAHTALQLLRENVGLACRTKVKQLEDNRRVLIEKIDALERSFNEALNVLKSNDRQMIKSICSSVDLVDNDRLGCLETDSLSAHTFLCEEIDGLLKEAIDQTSAANIKEKAKKQKFKPADDTSLDLGNISETVTPEDKYPPPPPSRLHPRTRTLPHLPFLVRYTRGQVPFPPPPPSYPRGQVPYPPLLLVAYPWGQLTYPNSPPSRLPSGTSTLPNSLPVGYPEDKYPPRPPPPNRLPPNVTPEFKYPPPPPLLVGYLRGQVTPEDKYPPPPLPPNRLPPNVTPEDKYPSPPLLLVGYRRGQVPYPNSPPSRLPPRTSILPHLPS